MMTNLDSLIILRMHNLKSKGCTCSRKDTNSFPLRVLPWTIFGRIMSARTCFNCSRFWTYIGSSSPSFMSQSFVRWRWGCLKVLHSRSIRSSKANIPIASVCICQQIAWIYNKSNIGTRSHAYLNKLALSHTYKQTLYTHNSYIMLLHR